MKKYTRKQKSRRYRKSHKSRQSRRTRQRGAGLSDVLPVTTWGDWNQTPGALKWSPVESAPAPLANGGLYTAPQSTGAWASSPFPATQYGTAVEAAKVSGIPEVFYHQRPTTDVGGSWSPYVGQSISNEHWSARLPSNVASVQGK
jgi:hypothetical protein